MQINGPNFHQSQFLRAARSVAGTQPVQQNNIETMTPQGHHYGPVSQLINSKYLHELRKDIRKVIKGRRLKQILAYDYDEDEFDNLPPSLQNLIKFDRTISSAEILQFIESFDLSHEITFRDYAFDRIKFRALFEALGDLLDVEMQAGPSTFVSLSDDFEVKHKVKEIFIRLKDKIRDKLRLKPGKRQILVEDEGQSLDEYGESV